MRKTALAVTAAILFTSGGWLLAQQAQSQGVPPVPPDIRTGADLGIRVHGMKNGRALGTLVIRTKNGDWVEVIPAPTGGFLVPLENK